MGNRLIKIIIKLKKQWYFSDFLTLVISANSLENALKIAMKKCGLRKDDIIYCHEEKKETKEPVSINKRIVAIKAVEKARREHHSFISVRSFKDIFSKYNLVRTFLRLENNLVKSKNKLDLLNKS